MANKNQSSHNLLQSRRIRELPIKLVMTVILTVIAVMMVVPFVWMLSASFKYERDVMKIPIQWIPKNPTLDNYKEILHIDTKSKDYHFLLAYWNSIKVTVSATVISVITAMMAGYAFAKLRFPGSNIIFIIYLAQMMVPSQLTLIPRFVLFSSLEMTNTHFSIVAPKLIAVSATFMMRQAFTGVPNELRESAMMDGASEWRTWWQIMVPQIKPTIGALATVQFLDSWNSYLDPLIFLSDWRLRTLPIALNQFVSEEGTQYNLVTAALLVAHILLPVCLLLGLTVMVCITEQTFPAAR